MKTTVEIADPLLLEAKRTAKRDGITLRELLEQGLRLVLDERKAAVHERFRLKDSRNKQGRLQPGIREGDWAQLRDLIYGYDELPEGTRGK